MGSGHIQRSRLRRNWRDDRPMSHHTYIGAKISRWDPPLAGSDFAAGPAQTLGPCERPAMTVHHGLRPYTALAASAGRTLIGGHSYGRW
ncbi:hypothetical protein Y032_0102g3507 [Ancylostoma ceylanicum]|uniref:Uncharacterized protein n=1 Tax=Ancylostoma ceylanicum TaxID=53326 RepID=A0A016THR6_9BILA|nr:hypothetical protein Y032_0102g3507 [Ancylostoma ceylanicum]